MLRYAITDRLSLASDEAECHAALLRQAVRLGQHGVDFLQLREKDLPATSVVALARALLPRLGATRLLISRRAEIALAVGAPGVHLSAAPGELTPAQVRELYARAGLHAPCVSISCHTLAEVLRAREHGATHILFGPVFGKQVGKEPVAPGVGLEALEAACRAAGAVPVLALGGITLADSAACLRAGAAGVAGIRLFR